MPSRAVAASCHASRGCLAESPVLENTPPAQRQQLLRRLSHACAAALALSTAVAASGRCSRLLQHIREALHVEVIQHQLWSPDVARTRSDVTRWDVHLHNFAPSRTSTGEIDCSCNFCSKKTSRGGRARRSGRLQQSGDFKLQTARWHSADDLICQPGTVEKKYCPPRVQFLTIYSLGCLLGHYHQLAATNVKAIYNEISSASGLHACSTAATCAMHAGCNQLSLLSRN